MTITGQLLTELVDLVRPAVTTDSHGNDDLDYGAAATRTPISGWLQQDARTETFPDGRNPAEQMWLMITDHADIDVDDRVEWANHPAGPITFTIHGPVEPAYTPIGGFHHTEATLRVLAG